MIKGSIDEDSLSKLERHEYYCLQNDERVDWEEYKINYKTNDPILHYIKNWKILNPTFNNFFDTKFYLATYSDIDESGMNPLVQFLGMGISEGREGFEKVKDIVHIDTTLNDVQRYEYDIIESFSLDWSSYFEDNEINDSIIKDPITHYLCNYQNIEPFIDNVFDTRLYYELYPDIMNSGGNPLIHYLRHGKSEGRTGWIDISSHILKGAIESKENMETLIIVTHESSATGAPLVSLNFSQTLCDRYNVINIVLRRKDLHNNFLASCEFLIEDINHSIVMQKIFDSFLKIRNILCVICNSVETFPVLQAASEMGLPTISLVHEFADYTRPIGKMSETIFFADRVIVPATIIRDAIFRELKEVYAIKEMPNNIVISPQGKLPTIPEGSGKNESKENILRKLNITNVKETKIIVGAGYVQIRKGVDLFLSMAKQVRERYNGPCKFIWVGAGYDPEADLDYSVWLKRQFELMSKDNDLIFMEHQKNLDNILELADVFALTSRLDPFPNVVIDAMEKNVHVACFKNSTGCADFLLKHKADASVVDYLDTSKMASAIVAKLKKKKRLNTKNSKIVKENLNFYTYLDNLVSLCKEAKILNENHEIIGTKLLDNKKFNAQFYNPEVNAEVACRSYIKLGAKGIHRFNPKPGFSDKEWIDVNGKKDMYQIALNNALLLEHEPQTHSVVMLKEDKNLLYDKRYAIHLHLYYIDLAEEFANYFNRLDGNFDIYITMVDMERKDEVKQVFEDLGILHIYIIEVDNVGRDISPFFSAIKDKIFQNRYDVIGHFHSKKSLEISEIMGNSWRKFMMDNLASNEVLSIFNDEKVGLVFTEDRHSVDFSENKPYADELCEAMQLPPMEHANIYPLGTMFWARVDALIPLFELDFSKYIQDEPLPYDGSYLHAVERLLPHISKQQGYEFKTVYKADLSW